MLLTSCSSIQSSVPIEKRTYDMCVGKDSAPTCDGFCYQDVVCTKRFLKICTKKEIQVVDKITMPIMDQKRCHELFNMNFVLKVRTKVL